MPQITPQEWALLRALGDGLSNKLIAEQMGITRRTVEHYRANLLLKFAARNTAQLMCKAAPFFSANTNTE